MTRINQATRILITVPVALAIASCSATNDTPATDQDASPAAESAAASAAQETVTQEKTVTEAAAQQPTSEEVEAAAAPAAAPETDNCAIPNPDPRQQYATGTAPGRMPAANHRSDANYWIEDIDNHYDPCAPLSWITFRGSLGHEDRTAGTAASITDGLALYVDGQPAGDMRAFTEVENVELVDPTTLRLSWGERGGATAEGITDHFTVDLTAANGTVQAVAGDTEPFTQRWNQSGYLLN